MRRFGKRGLPATVLAAVVLAGVLPGTAVAVGGADLPKLKQPRAVPVKPVAVGGAIDAKRFGFTLVDRA